MKRTERTKVIVAAMVMALGLSLAAGAQGFGPQLSDEEFEAAWRSEARSVMRGAEVDREKRQEVTTAYIEARKAHREKMQELTPGQGNFQAYVDLQEEHRGNFETKLKEVVTEEQAGKLLPMLGSFSWQWDRLTNSLLSFELEREENRDGMAAINAYVTAWNDAMAKARENQDFQSAFEPMQKAREDMNKAMGEVLSAEQLTKWEEDTAPRFGG